MKLRRSAILALTALPALLAAPLAAPAAADTPASALVARYNFDGGAVSGKVAELSGRGTALAVRGADNGTVGFTDRFATFPAPCTVGDRPCARALLEAPDDADLDPGTRTFRWAASVRLTRAQLTGNANVMQKGLANAATSQWKMQVGGKTGRAQCVMMGRGSAQAFIALSARPVADGAWHKVVCERTGTTLAVSVDGVQGRKVTVPAALTVDNTMPLRVGGPNFGEGADMFHGQLDDVYVQVG